MRADPDVLGVVKAGCKHRALLWFREYPSSDVNTIDRNIDYRSKFSSMIYDKTNVSQFSHESRSVASDGLTECIQVMVSLNIYKNSANNFGRKTGFKIENEIEDQDQSIPKFIGILTQVICTFGPNLVILACTGDELSCQQAQNGLTFEFEVKFDLEAQGQSPLKTIGILTKFFYTYGPNLVILA